VPRVVTKGHHRVRHVPARGSGRQELPGPFLHRRRGGDCSFDGEKLEALFVEVVEPTGVVFVDPYVATGDHTGCAPAAERWTAGHVPDDGFAYHSTALGHEVMATMITKALGD
jgi:hypothetical protein